jgi:very-short-patch-repair endonuclease
MARLAAEQHGVVSHAQLLSLGYSGAAIARGVVAGRLHQVHRGVYAVGHPQLSHHGRCMAAVLACGRNALLSHESAAWLWGLLPRSSLRPEVTAPARGHQRKAVSLHHSTILESEDASHCGGIPVTAVPRTLLDLFSRPRIKEAEHALQRSERLGLLEIAGVDLLLARCGRHRGRKRLALALQLYRDSDFTRSWLERRFLDLVLKGGLPRPAMNMFVEGREIDAYWEAERFAVELDGYEFHHDRKSFESDRRRQEELKLAGIEVVRFTARRIADHPREVVRQVAALLRQRRAELSSGRSTAGRE